MSMVSRVSITHRGFELALESFTGRESLSESYCFAAVVNTRYRLDDDFCLGEQVGF